VPADLPTDPAARRAAVEHIAGLAGIDPAVAEHTQYFGLKVISRSRWPEHQRDQAVDLTIAAVDYRPFASQRFTPFLTVSPGRDELAHLLFTWDGSPPPI